MFVNILLLLLLITKAQLQLILQEKLVYQMDISEFCKRRVLPSIFLAKNSVDTNSFIMHFAQIELPYSCPISVRTESGNNIIMVIKEIPLHGMEKRCNAKRPELLVHEMGETFGGYWGPTWKKVFERKSVSPKIYTLKTTETIPVKPIATYVPPLDIKSTKTTKPPPITEDSGEDGFINVEMPLVNVSGKFVSNENGLDEDKDAIFDIQYDVTPEPGVDYSTSVVPIVQFSIKSDPGWRKEGDDGEPRFELDIVEKYTPDHRLTKPHYESTKRLKFRKFSSRITTKRRHQYFRKNSTKGKLKTHRFSSHKYTDYNFPTKKHNFSRSYSWKTIEELINKVNFTASLQEEGNKKLSDEKNNILKEISDMKHNSSIYLKPNLYDLSKSSPSTTVKRTNTFSISKFYKTQSEYSTMSIKVTGNQVGSTSKSINHTTTSAGYSSLMKHDSVPSDINENYYLRELNTSSIVFNDTGNKSEPAQLPDKSLVDHESWENVVQSAPDMAVLLNMTKEGMKKHNIVTDIGTDNKRLRRKKREIHAIRIMNARPHNVTTSPNSTATTNSSFGVADMRDFSQLVEQADDELYGRVALRFLRRFVGPVIFNICDFNSSATQRVHLFNATRIVIAINNFTNLAGLTLVLTTARALVAGEIECPASNIECQVAGARVCIDSMAACDGVPNCGSYDVYDEDRLMCGKSEGLQHNVYIAAFTFLAVLLTLLYSVHYWLGRCVPKVADAFFIYTNGTENILILEPKMRSPNDYGDGTSKLFFHPSMFDDVDIMPKNIKPNFWKRFIKILCCGLTLRKGEIEKPESPIEKNEVTNFDTKIKYSFTQLQIQNIMGMAKMSFQSDSMELMNIKHRKTEKQLSLQTMPVLKSIDSILTLEEPLPEDYKDELGMLKFLKTIRRKSLSSDSKEVQLGTIDRFSITLDKNSEEMEIKSVDYNRHRFREPGPSGVQRLPKPGTSGIQNTEKIMVNSASKHLRFDDNTTMIPASIVEVDEDEEDIDGHLKQTRRHSTFLDTVMGKQKFFGASEDDNEPPLPREHKRFWGGSGKNKKPRPKNTN